MHVAIIGGGAAGCVLALRLARRGVNVTLLESGPRYSKQDILDRFSRHEEGRAGAGNPFPLKDRSIEAFHNAGTIRMPLGYERVRALGGTTLFWLGNSPRMLKDDFTMRSSFGVAEDWPVRYEEIEDYYAQAELEIGVSGADDNKLAEPRKAPYAMPAIPWSLADRLLGKAMDRLGYELHHTPQARNSVEYDGRSACIGCSYCQICPSGARATFDVTHALPAEHTGRVKILTQATALRLETGAQGRVDRVVYAGLDRVEHAVEADVFVAATGGIEVPRLLLLSAGSEHPEGLANRSGLVGRYLMNHPIMAVRGNLKERLYPFRVHFESSESFEFYATRDRGTHAAFLMNVNNTGGQMPVDFVRGARRWGDDLARHVDQHFGHVASLSAGIEQLPDLQNRVELDPERKDYFGCPIPLVTYGFDEYTQQGLDRAGRIEQEILTEAGAESFLPSETWWPGHHMGTTRMGEDPSTSVVDRDLRCHDVPNLYLCTMGAWVTGGCANPTLTLTAFALRLGDHLASGG